MSHLEGGSLSCRHLPLCRHLLHSQEYDVNVRIHTNISGHPTTLKHSSSEEITNRRAQVAYEQLPCTAEILVNERMTKMETTKDLEDTRRRKLETKKELRDTRKRQERRLAGNKTENGRRSAKNREIK